MMSRSMPPMQSMPALPDDAVVAAEAVDRFAAMSVTLIEYLYPFTLSIYILFLYPFTLGIYTLIHMDPFAPWTQTGDLTVEGAPSP